MQSILQPVLTKRVSLLLENPHGDHNRRLIELPEKPLPQEVLGKHKEIIKRLIRWRGVRNPKAYKDAFKAMDEAHNGDRTKFD